MLTSKNNSEAKYAWKLVCIMSLKCRFWVETNLEELFLSEMSFTATVHMSDFLRRYFGSVAF